MRFSSLKLLKTIVLLFILLAFYTIFRISFYEYNKSGFPELAKMDFIDYCLHGIRFDLSAILTINSLWILLQLLPFSFTQNKKYSNFSFILFMISNGLALLFELGDWVYFYFNHKRSTSDVLNMIARKGDFIVLIPDFFKRYWYLFIICALCLMLYAKIYHLVERKTNLYFNSSPESERKYSFVSGVSILLFASAGVITGIRGGFQLIPLSIRDAALASPARYTPIVLNTPFSIINSWQEDHLPSLHFMPANEARSIMNNHKQYGQSGEVKKQNVVIIIVEGLSKEFTKMGGIKSYTPFLDSLMTQSLTFTNAYANGLRSSDGIPAIISGIPPLMEVPFQTSVYSNNEYDAIPSLLRRSGYHTAFFHGATNGSMSFDIFARQAGYKDYYGRSEYNNEQDYDGSWGIFDEPFLQYFAKQMTLMPQPFMTTVFTLSSHPPFTLPEKYKNKFPAGTMPVHPAIAYTDYAIKRFFETASKQPWFINTLFIITADHCSPFASNYYYSAGLGRYQVPLLFYEPGNPTLKANNNTLIQHIDILPSVMDFLGYRGKFFAFGSSVFQPSEPHFFATKLSEVTEWINDGYLLKILDNKITGVYSFPEDTLEKNNIVVACDTIKNLRAARKKQEAFFQNFNDAVINNKMH